MPRSARVAARRAGRRRAVGTRDRIIAHLAMVAEISDPAGMASTRLAEAVGYPGSSIAFAQLLSGMERDGLISRDIRGKRTYRIALSPSANGARSGAAEHAAEREHARMSKTTAAPADGSSGIDYDELARRLLIQVVRRLAAEDGALVAENARLRAQLTQTQRELDHALERSGVLTVAGELDDAEVVVLERLLNADGAPLTDTA